MPSTTRYSQGDVVLLPFPFTDLSAAKRRPAVVISPERYNASHQDVVVLAVTSHLTAESPQDYRLTPEEQRAAGLPKPSLVKIDKVLTLEQTLILRRLGALPNDTVQRLVRRFQDFFSAHA